MFASSLIIIDIVLSIALFNSLDFVTNINIMYDTIKNHQNCRSINKHDILIWLMRDCFPYFQKFLSILYLLAIIIYVSLFSYILIYIAIVSNLKIER